MSGKMKIGYVGVGLMGMPMAKRLLSLGYAVRAYDISPQRMAEGHLGRMPYSWFYFDLVKNVSKDKTFHACQIPLDLVEMLIKSCTKPGDDVFILFGGSGSEL